MPEYESLAVLRRALTADDPDRRASAYGAVMEHDVSPSELLGSEPSDEVIERLRAADVLPEEAQSGMTVPEFHDQALDLLKQIADNTGGSA